jgi:hypothetical protein
VRRHDPPLQSASMDKASFSECDKMYFSQYMLAPPR